MTMVVHNNDDMTNDNDYDNSVIIMVVGMKITVVMVVVAIDNDDHVRGETRDKKNIIVK